MIFVVKGVFSQISQGKTAFSGGIYTVKPINQHNNKPLYNIYHRILNNNPALPARQIPYSIINADYYTRNFGFFCKKELQIEKTTKVSFKFRLGSIQYCDWMEGKKTAGILPNN